MPERDKLIPLTVNLRGSPSIVLPCGKVIPLGEWVRTNGQFRLTVYVPEGSKIERAKK